MPESDLALLTDAARAAGHIARRHFGNGPANWEKGDAQGPVSVADLEINDMLRDMLCGTRPDYGWLSEESTDDHDRLHRERTFIVDPIDGTRAFLAGEHSFAHALAVAENGQVTAAAVYLPMRDELFTARIGAGAFLNGQPIGVSKTTSAQSARVLSNRASLDPRHWQGAVPGFSRHFRPSLAWRMCLVADGSFDAMLTLRPTWEWDVAAGCLIVAEAGGISRIMTGQPPVFNNPDPRLAGLIAGPSRLTTDLVTQLKPSSKD